MGLPTGKKLGPYEIQSPLGVGGMGEVYRARDTRLHRDVAIKVLPSVFSEDADRLRRFEQEARTTAALRDTVLSVSLPRRTILRLFDQLAPMADDCVIGEMQLVVARPREVDPTLQNRPREKPLASTCGRTNLTEGKMRALRLWPCQPIPASKGP